MQNLDAQTQDRLTRLAYRKTIPYCYSCAAECPKGRCPQCLSDDLMRLLPGDGCDWGTDWVIKSLVGEALESVDTEEAFEASVRECYPETTKLGWLELDTARAIKELDPVSWDIAHFEWVSNEESEGLITSFDHGSTYFLTSDVESFLDENVECETAEAVG